MTGLDDKEERFHEDGLHYNPWGGSNLIILIAHTN